MLKLILRTGNFALIEVKLPRPKQSLRFSYYCSVFYLYGTTKYEDEGNTSEKKQNQKNYKVAGFLSFSAVSMKLT